MTANEIETLIRNEYSGDRNPRPDLLAKKIVALIARNSGSVTASALVPAP